MRYIYAILFIALSVPASSQRVDTLISVSKNKSAAPVIRIRCYTSLQPDQPPLYIVDGELINSKSLGLLDKNDIESIEILKEASATAIYGTRGVSGVIIIKTKESRFRSFQAIDAEDNTSLAGATFTFTAVDGTEVIRLVADEEGMVMSTSFPVGKKYTLLISSVGYKDFQTTYTREKQKTVQHYRLSRDVKEDAPVVVKSNLRVIRCTFSFSCRGTGIKITQGPEDSLGLQTMQSAARLFPNPVARGAMLKLELSVKEESPFQAKIINLSGVTLSAVPYKPVKGFNRVEIPVSSQWAAGVYFLQVISQQGTLLKQDKLIIQ